MLVQLKQYAAAERHYREAMRHRPDLAAAQAGLGLLYWQLGREAEAQTLLREAFRADPFHIRVANALKVLEHLAQYTTRETEHFVIKSSEADKVLAAWLADYSGKMVRGVPAEIWLCPQQQGLGRDHRQPGDVQRACAGSSGTTGRGARSKYRPSASDSLSAS
ncbi:MAG: hypothetical protein KatS3mg106_006 [Gemmataceae bacterium]|nr:MAG: hypothetical protein KatS3mg106_006 [Gemmataceae bacterium]